MRSSVRAFATYRLSDAGLLIATVTTFELLGSARFSALDRRGRLPPAEATVLALLFLLSAMGKSAQLPFSGWLPRAMEGPTPSSALFYGAVSIHAGLFLLLRVWPVLEVSLVARAVGVARRARHGALRRRRGPRAHRREGRAGARHAGAGRPDPRGDLPGVDDAGARRTWSATPSCDWGST